MKQRYTTTDFANLQKAKALYRKTGGLVSPKAKEVTNFRLLMRNAVLTKNAFVANCKDDNVLIFQVYKGKIIAKQEFTDLLTNNPKHVCTKH